MWIQTALCATDPSMLPAMDARLEALLDQLHRDGVVYDAARSDRRERRRNLEPDSARLLHLLVLATGAERLLELGSSNGYSQILLRPPGAPHRGRWWRGA